MMRRTNRGEWMERTEVRAGMDGEICKTRKAMVVRGVGEQNEWGGQK